MNELLCDILFTWLGYSLQEVEKVLCLHRSCNLPADLVFRLGLIVLEQANCLRSFYILQIKQHRERAFYLAS